MSLRKGAITRRGGLSAFKPVGLVPQQVISGLTNNDPTRDTYQRKVFYDGTNFFIAFWDVAQKRIRCTAGDGIHSWVTPVEIQFYGSGSPYAGGNADVQYPTRGALDNAGHNTDVAFLYLSNNGGTLYWRPRVISGTSLVSRAVGTWATTTTNAVSCCANLDGYNYLAHHRLVLGVTPWIQIGKSPNGSVPISDQTTAPSNGAAVTGGIQILPYKSSSGYNMVVIVKNAANVLWLRQIDTASTIFLGSWAQIATLGTGFSDFCGCSEAQSLGAPEKIHMVYIKSTGELCYNKFANDALGVEKVLVASGASYPVVAVGSGGKLYVLYVKDGKVWVIYDWLSPVELFTASHTYNNPAYLSCNQNVQGGLICLVWTEGSTSSYSVWFCNLED